MRVNIFGLWTKIFKDALEETLIILIIFPHLLKNWKSINRLTNNDMAINNNNESQLWKYKVFAEDKSDMAWTLSLPLQVMTLLCSKSFRSHSIQLSSWEGFFLTFM